MRPRVVYAVRQWSRQRHVEDRNAGPTIGSVPYRDEPVVLDRHPGLALDHARIDDILASITLHLAQQRRDRHGTPWDDRLHVGVHEISQLITIMTKERANLGHDAASSH